MPTIATLTVNPTIDKSTTVDSVASEIKLRCTNPSFDPGGGGINVSRAVKKLGGESTAYFTSGGAVGQMLSALVNAEDIITEPIAIREFTRENLTVYEESSGLQYRFGMPGPRLSEQEWQQCLDEVLDSEADYIVASGSLAPAMPTDFYKQLATRAKSTQSRVIIDTSGEALEACANAEVFLFKPNLRELEILSGKKFEGEAQIASIAQELIADGMAEVLVVSMGASGAMLVTAEKSVRMRPPVVPIQSKVGAGDSMVGGIVWSLANGDDLQQAVQYGIAAGTAAVMTPGTELCRHDDVMRIVQEIAVLD